MPLSGLIATSEPAPEARYRERRAPWDRHAKPEFPAASAPVVANDGGDVFDAAYYGRRFKTDLSQLKVFAEAEEAPPPADPVGDAALIDFFGHLSLLLVAVRAGDIARAQAAADALEFDALVERNVARQTGGPGAALGDLVAHFGAPASRDPNANAVADAAEDGGAAYDTLAQYLDGETGAP